MTFKDLKDNYDLVVKKLNDYKQLDRKVKNNGITGKELIEERIKLENDSDVAPEDIELLLDDIQAEALLKVDQFEADRDDISHELQSMFGIDNRNFNDLDTFYYDILETDFECVHVKNLIDALSEGKRANETIVRADYSCLNKAQNNLLRQAIIEKYLPELKDKHVTKKEAENSFEQKIVLEIKKILNEIEQRHMFKEKQLNPNEVYIKTNIGNMPLLEYYEIRSRQCGYSDYAQMLKDGCHFDIGDIDPSYLFTKDQIAVEEEKDGISRMLEAITDKSEMVIDSIDEKTIKTMDKGELEWEI